MDKFAVGAIICCLMFGTLFMTYIMFDYAFWHDEHGAFYKLSDALNNSMDATRQQDAFEQGQMFRQGMGIGMVINLGLCIVFFVAYALNRNPGVRN